MGKALLQIQRGPGPNPPGPPGPRGPNGPGPPKQSCSNQQQHKKFRLQKSTSKTNDSNLQLALYMCPI